MSFTLLAAIIELQDNITFTSGMLGLFFAVPLLTMRRQRFANIYLGMFLVAFSLLCIASTQLYYSYPQLFGLLDWPLSCLGAFYYLYVRAMCGYKTNKRDFLHYIPLFVFSTLLLINHFELVQTGIKNHFGYYLLFFQLLTICYAVAVIFLLKKYRLAVKNNYSSNTNRDLNWLSWLTVTIISLLIIWIPATIYQGIWIGTLILGRWLVLFFVGWYGLRQKFVFVEKITMQQPSVTDDFASENKYQRSGMNETIKDNIGFKLQQIMLIEKDFLKSDLKLTDLAVSIDTSPQHLSEYFNQVLGVNFSTYINELRVTEAKSLLRDPANKSLSILEIAFASGFNSKSTFNAFFKKNSDVSPTIWRNKHIQASEPI